MRYSLSDFDYDLPPAQIATHPTEPREAARLLLWPQGQNGAKAKQYTFADLPQLLDAGDVLVLNNTKVIPARLYGSRPRRQQEGDVQIEFLLHKPVAGLCVWEAFAKPAKRLKAGQVVYFPTGVQAMVQHREEDRVVLAFDVPEQEIFAFFDAAGEMPLPPYIARPDGATAADKNDYQTVFAEKEGSVAAPTAGLHFSEDLLQALAQKGVQIVYVTLHVGAGTFQPVRSENLAEHKMHSEWAQVTDEVVAAVEAAKARGNKVIAVGTTALRTLEGAAAATGGKLMAFEGDVDIFITPGFSFKVVDRLITNFHLPKSTLLMLVAAFVGYDAMRKMYATAIGEGYRFYSYGDGSLLSRQQGEDEAVI